MYLVYIDDSYSTGFYCFSAVAVHSDYWKQIFREIRRWRKQLKSSDGLYVYKELHATDLVAGRGRISSKIVGKYRRCQIYREGLSLLAAQRGVRIFNACSSHSQLEAFERLLNRINVTMEKTARSHSILLCDEGAEGTYTRLARKMAVHNYIPSKYGRWPDGSYSKNLPTNHILEDPIFKKSSKSYFVQLADFCAYAILQKERPHPARKRYGLHLAWRLIRPRFVLMAHRKDPDGIIR